MNDNKNFFDDSVVSVICYCLVFFLIFVLILCSFTYCSFFSDNDKTIGTSSSVETVETTNNSDFEFYKNYYNSHHTVVNLFGIKGK